MERLQAFKFELMPTGEHARKMRQFAGACRFVYNKALALQKENHAAGGKFIGKFEMKKRFTGWRKSTETPWLADAPRHPVDEAILDLDRAFQNFFAGRAEFPRFKRKAASADSFRYPDAKQIRLDRENGRISLPKLGYIRYRNSRMVLGEVRSATVSLRGGKWFVSILTRREVEQPLPQGPAVGIDVGVKRFATLSDGAFIAPLASFKKYEQRLAKYQRRMASKVKGSSNWKKAKARVQRIHARIANARSDFLHKASDTISKNHALIAVEDLQVRNMSKSASGTVGAPGRNVRAKSGLNKAILDQGWFEFRRQLGYKVAWRGGFFVAVPPRNTSRECPPCGHISADNRKTQALFRCVSCGYEANADQVGAMNTLARGLKMFEGMDMGDASPARVTAARIACGESALSGRSVKQEPTEATQAALA